MEKVGFGRVRVYPNIEISGSGMSGIEKLGFGRVRVLKVRVRAGISGTKKINFYSLSATFVQLDDTNIYPLM